MRCTDLSPEDVGKVRRQIRRALDDRKAYGIPINRWGGAWQALISTIWSHDEDCLSVEYDGPIPGTSGIHLTSVYRDAEDHGSSPCYRNQLFLVNDDLLDLLRACRLFADGVVLGADADALIEALEKTST